MLSSQWNLIKDRIPVDEKKPLPKPMMTKFTDMYIRCPALLRLAIIYVT